MPTFMERLRAPLLLGGGFDGSETAGQSDAGSRAASLHELDRLLGGRLSGRGGGSRLAMRGPGGNPKVNPYGRAVDPVKGPMNVVYDQGPEQFNKKLKLEEKELEVKGKTAEALAGLKAGQLDVNQQRADAYEFGVRNPQGQVIQPRGGNATVINRRTGQAIDTGVNTGTMTQDDELAARAKAALAQGAQRNEGQSNLETQRQGGRVDLAEMAGRQRAEAQAAQDAAAAGRQQVAQEFQAGQARQRPDAINSRAREVANQDPSLQQWMEFDPSSGDFQISPNTPPDILGEINRRIYTPRNVPLGQQPGVSNQSNLNPAVTGTQGQTQIKRQRNPQTGQTRISTDGGRTWRIE